MQEITLLKSTIVEGTFRKAGWNGEVSPTTKRTLLSMGKIEADEAETVAVSLAVDVTNSEEFEQMQDENKTLKEANASLIVGMVVAKNSLQISQANLEEHKGENARLNNEIETLKQTVEKDIKDMTLKDLREKYLDS